MKRKLEQFVCTVIFYGTVVLCLTVLAIFGGSAFEKRNPFWGATLRALLGLHMFVLGSVMVVVAFLVHLSLFVSIPIGIIGVLILLLGSLMLAALWNQWREK
ncbi:MAG: hypothetical protein M0P64_04365 [Candidatus Pacebacteria bacterium]|jgi:hypothetical protein|nr:hypothetical protein [Candidatus Paceibacterota bacterium]